MRKLGGLRPSYDKSAVFNVAHLLVGARAAYLPDSMEDVVGYAAAVRDMFPDRIGLIMASGQHPVLHRIGALSAADIRILTASQGGRGGDGVSPKDIPDKVYRRILGYTGTAFPCSQHADAVLIEWVFVEDGGRTRPDLQTTARGRANCRHASTAST